MLNKMSFRSQINTIYPSLTKSEKKVASYVLDNVEELGLLTLSQLSKRIGVGEATIMRFIYKLGYENIAEFKVASVKDSVMEKQNEVKDNFAATFINDINSFFQDTLAVNNLDNYKKVAKMIEQAEHVYFFGNGTSGFAASAGAYRFFRAGVSCEAITDVHMMVMKASLAKKNELVIAVSLSGDNVDIINAVKLAKKNKCSVVTITGRKLSTLNDFGDVSLNHAPISMSENSYYGGMIGIIVQEFLLEVIFNAYSYSNPERIDEAQRITTISTNMHHEVLMNKK